MDESKMRSVATDAAAASAAVAAAWKTIKT